MSLLPNKFVNLDISTCDVQQGSSVFRVFKGLTPFLFLVVMIMDLGQELPSMIMDLGQEVPRDWA